MRPKYDIVNEVLEECILAYPISSFIISLYKQYLQRGSLSKKQLQGLFGKASKIPTLEPGKLATLEALIKKMPTRLKSNAIVDKPLQQKEDDWGTIISAILEKYPKHKMAIFLQSKHDNNETLTSTEISDLKRFHQMLVLKK